MVDVIIFLDIKPLLLQTIIFIIDCSHNLPWRLLFGNNGAENVATSACNIRNISQKEQIYELNLTCPKIIKMDYQLDNFIHYNAYKKPSYKNNPCAVYTGEKCIFHKKAIPVYKRLFFFQKIMNFQ